MLKIAHHAILKELENVIHKIIVIPDSLLLLPSHVRIVHQIVHLAPQMVVIYAILATLDTI